MPTAPIWEVTNGTNSFVLPQVWTSGNTTSVYNYQYYVTDNTLTMIIPPNWNEPQDMRPAVPLGTGTMNVQLPTAEQSGEPPLFGTVELVPETPAQQAERARLQAETAAAAEELRQRQEQRRQERAEANRRAEELLHMFLSPAQAEEYARDQALTVQAPSGRRYRLRRMLSGGVQELDAEGKVRATLCIHPTEDCPTADMLISQLHLIHADETEFRRIANHRRVA